MVYLQDHLLSRLDFCGSSLSLVYMMQAVRITIPLQAPVMGSALLQAETRPASWLRCSLRPVVSVQKKNFKLLFLLLQVMQNASHGFPCSIIYVYIG